MTETNRAVENGTKQSNCNHLLSEKLIISETNRELCNDHICNEKWHHSL